MSATPLKSHKQLDKAHGYITTLHVMLRCECPFEHCLPPDAKDITNAMWPFIGHVHNVCKVNDVCKLLLLLSPNW